MRMKRANGRATEAAASFRRACLILSLVGIGAATIGMPRALAQGGAETQAQAPQVAAPAAPNGPATAGAASSNDALSTRYRLIEKYALSANPATPEVLTQYQVATRETIKMAREQPQGTPMRDERVYQVIYSERPAKITNNNGVTDTVRRYEAFRVQPAQEFQRLKIPMLEKLTVWYRLPTNQPPQIFSLTRDRSIREAESGAIASQIYFPQLVTILPTTAKRIGDTWRVPRSAVRALLGIVPQDDEYELTASLKEIRKGAGSTSTAVIAVTGHVAVNFVETAVNARLMFSFDPKNSPKRDPAPPATGGAAGGSGTPGEVEAHGSIDEVRMALAWAAPLPDGDGRLKQSIVREVVAGRRPQPPASEAIIVPTIEPDPASITSWPVYDDPEGRFHFLHPQYLRVPPNGLINPDQIALFDQRPAGTDLIAIDYQLPTKDPIKDRQLLDPDYHHRQLEQEWKKKKETVLAGPKGWLPEAEWAPLKRKVYRIEAALIPSDDPNAKRIYFDYYLVIFERNQSFALTAMTTQDPHVDFRKQVEDVIKSFDFGTSDGSPPPVASPARSSRPGAEGGAGAERTGGRAGAGAGAGAPAVARPRGTTPGSAGTARPASPSATPNRTAPRPRPDDSEPSPFPQ